MKFFIACCIQVVDLGTQRINATDGDWFARKIMFTWELIGNTTADDRGPQAVYKIYNLSFSEGSDLRQDLQSWLGDEYKNRIRQFDLKSLLGKYCILELISHGGELGSEQLIQKITPLPNGFDQSTLEKPSVQLGIFNISTPDMEMFKRLPHAIQEQIESSQDCKWRKTKISSSKYKFPKSHQDGVTAKYVKLTKELYYCRINHPDGTNTFHYTYHEDPGGNKFSMSQDEYKAIRGISEQLLESW